MMVLICTNLSWYKNTSAGSWGSSTSSTRPDTTTGTGMGNGTGSTTTMLSSFSAASFNCC